ncbi:MAG: hypothetical protein C0176_08720 [Mesoaciditoga sp.]|nr:MAG: hypothetical protein C0176_08720 [Mesoaciditoga sp.]
MIQREIKKFEVFMDNVVKLVFEIAKIGKSNKTFPPIKEVKPFHHFFIDDRIDKLNELDGPWTREKSLHVICF